MSCRYTLVLRYGTNKFYLAPRSSITISEGNDLEALANSGTAGGCATCGSKQDRTWTLKVYFGSCSLASAQALFNSVKAFIDAGCANGDLTIERTVCDEVPLVYQVRHGQVRMADTLLQLVSRPRAIVMELTLELVAWVEQGEGAVLVGA